MRLSMLLATVASILLIIAQTSWWTSYVLNNSLEGTEFANYIWAVFNSLTMIVFIIISLVSCDKNVVLK